MKRPCEAKAPASSDVHELVIRGQKAHCTCGLSEYETNEANEADILDRFTGLHSLHLAKVANRPAA